MGSKRLILPFPFSLFLSSLHLPFSFPSPQILVWPEWWKLWQVFYTRTAGADSSRPAGPGEHRPEWIPGVHLHQPGICAPLHLAEGKHLPNQHAPLPNRDAPFPNFPSVRTYPWWPLTLIALNQTLPIKLCSWEHDSSSKPSTHPNCDLMTPEDTLLTALSGVWLSFHTSIRQNQYGKVKKGSARLYPDT